jgi:serine/threonine-protein kinase
MLTSTGAKLLDFGIAKVHVAPVAGAGVSMLPTTPPSLTAQGALVGTLQYIAPEQLEGGEADARTDIFAFGAVVHEMLTGRKAFGAKSSAGLIAAILEHEPVPISSVQTRASSALDRLVITCLAKNPDDRWQSAGDLLRELKWIAEGRAASDRRVAGIASSTRFRWLAHAGVAWSIALFSLIGVVAAALLMRPDSPPSSLPQPALRASITLPDGARLAHSGFPVLALSPLGTHLAYVAEREGVFRLYLRRMDTFETEVIPGSEGAVSPFFSPDGQWIGFAGGGKLKKVSIGGGRPVALADAMLLFGAAWGPDDTIVYGAGDIGLSRISSSGGQATAATSLDPRAKEDGHLWPHFLPDGKSMLLTVGTVGTNMEGARIVLYSLETGLRRVLIEGGSHAQYVASGHIVYGVGGSLMAAPFDLATGTVTGTGVPVVHGVTRSDNGVSQFSVSRSGALVYASGPVMTPKRTLVWIDRLGKETPLPLPSRAYWPPRLSPDGRRLAVGIEGPTHDIWVSDVERDTLARLTFGADSYWPLWTPDGKRIVFQSNRTGPWNIFRVPVDRSSPEQQVALSDNQLMALFLSPDGQEVVYGDIAPSATPNASAGSNVWSVPLAGPPVPKRLDHLNALITPVLSPDGHWMAYVSTDTGRNEVSLQRYPEGGPTRQISNDAGSGPAWARSGRELFYVAGDRSVRVFDVTATGTDLTLGEPRDLFTIPFPGFGPNITLEVSPDGQRFLFVEQGVREPGPTQVNFVQGWLQELTARAPPDERVRLLRR